eukprot:TRINITY_DN2743_c0_g1_i1.p1 TRINITY_DN2743_c0_g1~~TRINITY_DN2743_c0_g1_i1.p1  ORF type:complete len:377 (-),score=100.68 TRINITY_DN2743_c0_g1_i1:108-1238(-)
MESANRRLKSIQQHIQPEDTASDRNRCPYMEPDRDRVFSRLLVGMPLRICVTGAAGNIAYSLIFKIAAGEMFGPRQQIALHLLDVPQAAEGLRGVHMELVDCAYPLISEIVATTDVSQAFKMVDVAILVGAFPRQKGMERKDLLQKNAAIFKEQGKAINDYASRNVKVLVVGNPANTNCWLAAENAPEIPKTNFSALTRLDQNRGTGQIAQRLSVPASTVKNVVIWGNHSATQYPDVSLASITDHPVSGVTSSVASSINDEKWIRSEFITTVQQRGAEIIKARKLSSAASAAQAIVDHLRDWLMGTADGRIVSMAVVSDGSYGVPKGIVFSFPVRCRAGNFEIIQGIPLSTFSQEKMQITAKELIEERDEALAFLK